jgi:putative phage-type endonuclease
MGSTPIGISGSRAAAVLGMSPYSTPFKVWQDIMEKRVPGFNESRKYKYVKFDGNVATRWGHAFEDAVIELAEKNNLYPIVNREGAYSLVGYPYITCHIDGKYAKFDATLHEGKTTTIFGFNERWGEPGTDKIPIEYQIQVQHQMLCTGARECIVSVLVFPERPDAWEEKWIIPGIDPRTKDGVICLPDGTMAFIPTWAHAMAQMGFFHQYTIKADPDLQQMMLEAYEEWWEAYVRAALPPEPKDYDDIKAMITEPAGTIIVDGETARWFKEYEHIGSEIGTGSDNYKRREQLKTLILSRARKLKKTIDDESDTKWVFRDGQGNKLGQYSKTKTGKMMFTA